MSKRVEAKITCPNCNHQFDFTLYRSIWGEYPENRDLVMSDKINVAKCPNCLRFTKLQFPFIYTNANQHFAVWWEPTHDPQIDSDAASYAKIMGPGNYLATAPRIEDWFEFKETIQKFENSDLKGKKPVMSDEMGKQMEGFLKHLKDQNKKKENTGCMFSFFFLISLTGALAYTVTKLY